MHPCPHAGFALSMCTHISLQQCASCNLHMRCSTAKPEQYQPVQLRGTRQLTEFEAQLDCVSAACHAVAEARAITARQAGFTSHTAPVQAFEAGGGGKKTAAVHALAAAQLAARKASGAEAETSEPKQSAPSGPDPRLQPPDRADRIANFKPGAATWNTDDPKQVMT